MKNAGVKKEKYKISVIVAVYNASEYLEQSIDSILLQTYQNIELLLIDDESTDGSGAICDRYAQDDERVRVIHRKNGGCTAASLTGLAQASGDYYMFVDSDDYVDTEMLREMSRHLIGKKGEIVCCNYKIEKTKQSVSVTCPAKPGIYEGARLKSEIKAHIIGREERTIPISRCMKLYEKSVFEGNEKYCDTAIHMGEDFNLVYPALLDCSRLVVMENAFFYHYRYVDGSMVHGYHPNILESIDRVRALWYRVAEGKDIGDIHEAADREYCYMLILVMKNELRNPDKSYIRNIQDIFTRPQIREKIVGTPISLHNRANALLYLGMQYPNKTLLWILRMILRKNDRKG